MIIIGDRVMVVYRGVERVGTVVSTHPQDFLVGVKLDHANPPTTLYFGLGQIVVKAAV
jgi:hypothetical protein